VWEVPNSYFIVGRRDSLVPIKISGNRGCKRADKLDVGVICLRPTEADKKFIQPIIESQRGFLPEPNLVYHVYKVRRGKLNNIKLWIYFDYSTCRTTDLFVTTNDYKLIDIEATTIEKILEMTEEEDDDETLKEFIF
jgi:hypothetical protein